MENFLSKMLGPNAIEWRLGYAYRAIAFGRGIWTPVLETRRKEEGLGMTNRLSTVKNSAKTGKSAKSSRKKPKRKTPFSRGSIREKAFLFLQKPRTLAQLNSFVKKKGLLRVRGLLRLFRSGVLDGEFLWILVEVPDRKIKLTKTDDYTVRIG
jgi:hypothetical protein